LKFFFIHKKKNFFFQLRYMWKSEFPYRKTFHSIFMKNIKKNENKGRSRSLRNSFLIESRWKCEEKKIPSLFNNQHKTMIFNANYINLNFHRAALVACSLSHSLSFLLPSTTLWVWSCLLDLLNLHECIKANAKAQSDDIK
jgi:hypothetical protein